MKLWYLNFDAEYELATGHARDPGKAKLRRFQELTELIREDFPGDVLLAQNADVAPLTFAGLEPVAWCPTPHAIACLQSWTGRAFEAPSFEVLRTVNERGFGRRFTDAADGVVAPELLLVQDIQQLATALSTFNECMVHAAYTAAGTGHRVIQGPLRAEDTQWCKSHLVLGPLYVSRLFRDIAAEFSFQGRVSVGGDVEVLCGKHCRVVGGTWRSSATFLSLPGSRSLSVREECLIQRTREVGSALFEVGYWGPFGCDGLALASGDCIYPNDINARYCMGFWDQKVTDPLRL